MENPFIIIKPHGALKDHSVVEIQYPGCHLVCIYTHISIVGEPIVRVIHHSDVRVEEIIEDGPLLP
jgi:hypothetical protein